MGGVEEDPLDEIEQEEADLKDATDAQRFRMKSGVLVSVDSDGQDRESVIMMYDLGENIRFKTITQKF